jgi:hypothetical protein
MLRRSTCVLGTLSALVFVALPAAADITINVNVSWHDFQASAAAVLVTTANFSGFSDTRTCQLNLADAYSGSCTVVFPDSDADPSRGNGSFYANEISLLSGCPATDFDGTQPLNCGQVNGRPASASSPGAWFYFDAQDEHAIAFAGQSVDYNIALANSRALGTVTGTIHLPPGAEIVQGVVHIDHVGAADPLGPYSIEAVGPVTPNPDGSLSYSVPALVGNSDPSMYFYLRLASGTEVGTGAAFPFGPPTAGGQTVVEPDVPASSLTYIKGSIVVNAPPQIKSAQLFEHDSLFGANTIAINLATGSYDLLAFADSTVYLYDPLISTCDNLVTFCQTGTSANFFYFYSTIDTTGMGGQTMDGPPLEIDSEFSTLYGTISLNGSPAAGNGSIGTFDNSNGQYTVSAIDATGAYDVMVGEGYGFGGVSMTPPGCPYPLTDYVFPFIGASPVQQDFAFNVDTGLPGTALLTLGLNAWDDQPSLYKSFNVAAEYQGNATHCNGGETATFPIYFGDQNGTAISNLAAGTWTFRYTGFNEGLNGSEYVNANFAPPPITVVIPSAGTAPVTFPATAPDFSGSLDASRWQIGPNDSASLGAGTSGSNGDGSFFEVNAGFQGPPPNGTIPIDLLVAANEPLTPMSLNASVLYSMGSGFSVWSTYATAPPVQPLASGTGSLPGLDALQINGVGTWTIANPAPANALFSIIQMSYGTGSLNLFSEGFNAPLQMKVPAGNYGTGPTVWVNWLDPTTFQFNAQPYAVGGEVAGGDVLNETVQSPVLVNRTPAPGTYCARQGENDNVADDGVGGTMMQITFQVASDPAQLKSVSVGGHSLQPNSSGTVKQMALLPLGTWPLNVSATQKSGDVTSWDRTYTVPSQIASQGYLGALVADGSTPVEPSVGVKLGSTVPLQLAVTSCGRAVSNPNAYAQKPRLVEVSRAGQDLALATIDPGGEDSDGDVDFSLGGGPGVWTLRLKTSLLGTGTFLMKFQAPDRSLWNAMLVVKP